MPTVSPVAAMKSGLKATTFACLCIRSPRFTRCRDEKRTESLSGIIKTPYPNLVSPVAAMKSGLKVCRMGYFAMRVLGFTRCRDEKRTESNQSRQVPTIRNRFHPLPR